LGHATRDLQIDHAVWQIRVLQHIQKQRPPVVGAITGVDPDLVQAAQQARNMLVHTKRLAAINRHHFVDAVSEDKATIQHRHLGVAQADELTIQPNLAVYIDISNHHDYSNINR